MRAQRWLAGLLVWALAAEGCGHLAAEHELPLRRPAAAPPASRAAELLLAAEEDAFDFPVEAAPPTTAAAPGPRGIALRVAGGMSLPGRGAIGEAGQAGLPTYSDVLDIAFALDVSAEFGGRRSVCPYAQLSTSSFTGRIWLDPYDDHRAWIADDATVTALLGGVKLGGGSQGRPYAKVGAGLLFWPELSLVDYFTDESASLFESSAGFAFSVGAGVELRIAGLNAFADIAYLMGPPPSATGEAEALWPGFEATDGLNILSVTGGLRLDF